MKLQQAVTSGATKEKLYFLFGGVYLISLFFVNAAERYFFGSPGNFIIQSAVLGVIIAGIGLFGPSFQYLKQAVKPTHLTVALAVFLISAVWAVGLFGERRFPVGDEPSYLMITHSLAEDLDINMNDDYADNAYFRFYTGKYPMFTHLGTNGVNYPHHSIGLPLILAPIYFILLLIGKTALFVPVMRLCMAIIYAFCAYRTSVFIEKFSGSIQLAVTIALAAFLSGPLFFYSLEIYPEILAAVCLVFSSEILFYSNYRWTVKGVFIMGCMIGYLPWLGIKYIITGLAFVSLASFLLIKQKKFNQLAIFYIPIAISFILYMCFLYSIYHNVNPSIIYTGVKPGTGIANAPQNAGEFFTTLPSRLYWMSEFYWGVLIEQRIGILFYGPIYIFIVPGLMAAFRRRQIAAAGILLLAITHLSLYAWQNNWGGYCPPNRQIIAVAPLLLPLVAIGFSVRSSRFAILFSRFSILYGWLLAWIFAQNDRWLYHTMNPHLSGGAAHILQAINPLPSFKLASWFPLIMGDIHHSAANVIWSIGFVMLAFTLTRIQNRFIIPALSMRSFNYFYFLIWLFSLIYLYFFMNPGISASNFDNQPYKKMYYLDDNHLGDEQDGFWTKGGATAQIVLGFDQQASELEIDLYSLSTNEAFIDFGGFRKRAELAAGEHVFLTVKPRRWFKRGDLFFIKCSIATASGAIPSKIFLESKDSRYLGAFIRIRNQSE